MHAAARARSAVAAVISVASDSCHIAAVAVGEVFAETLFRRFNFCPCASVNEE